MMALPGQQQTFAIDSCRDMLDKLRWEIEQLKLASDDVQPVQYGCYNAAVTAWQLADWVYAEATTEQRKTLKIKTLGELQEKARSECRELYLCYYLANASKHREVTLFIDPSINAGVEATSDEIPTWEAFVDDGGQKRPATEVFIFVLHYWTGIIYQNGIAIGPKPSRRTQPRRGGFRIL
jgi:hypothetical protein